MTKRVVAVTSIQSDKFKIAPGDTLDVTKVTKEQLKELHDLGAIRIEEVAEESKIEKIKVVEEDKKEEPKSNTIKPKTPETLKPIIRDEKPNTIVKTASAPPSRLTKENIAQTGANTSKDKAGTADGKSDTK